MAEILPVQAETETYSRYNDDEYVFRRQRQEERVEGQGEENRVAMEIKSTFICEAEAPLKKHSYTVYVELISASPEQGSRLGMDIVMVLDVSSNMEEDNKLEHMKAGARFVINKLFPPDRLSIVAFEGETFRLCPLRVMTRSAKKASEQLVDELLAGGGTNVMGGLKEARKILDDRHHSSNTEAAILLMSDIITHIDDVGVVSFENVPVYVIALGNQQYPQELENIANNSKRGTLTVVDVKDKETSENFILVVNRSVTTLLGSRIDRDVKLTIISGRQSKIKTVSAGNFMQYRDDSGTSITVSFGHLAPEERRSALVHLDLDDVDYLCGMEVAEYTFSYSDKYDDTTRKSSPVIVTVLRTTTPTIQKSIETLVTEHQTRALKIKEDRELDREQKFGTLQREQLKKQELPKAKKSSWSRVLPRLKRQYSI